MASYGKLEEFDSEKEEWQLYMERLDQYFLANGITDAAKQKAIFLSVCGSKTYSLLRGLVHPEKPGDKSLHDLQKVLTEHYTPRPTIIVERFKFHNRMRKEGESILDYIAELRKITEHCSFGNVLEDMLRDRLVCGVQDEKIQRQLLSEQSLAQSCRAGNSHGGCNEKCQGFTT